MQLRRQNGSVRRMLRPPRSSVLEQEARLKNRARCLRRFSQCNKNLDTLQNKVTQIEEGQKEGNGALGAQLKGLNDQQACWTRKPVPLSAALRKITRCVARGARPSSRTLSSPPDCWNMSISTPRWWSRMPMGVRCAWI